MDIQSLKEEISNRKKNLDQRKNVLGEKVSTKVSGDVFLRELMHSARTGQETNASVKVKQVDRIAEAKQIAKKTGKPIDPNILNHVTSTTAPSNNHVNINQQGTSAAMDARMAEAKRIREAANNPNINTTQQSSNSGISDVLAQYMNTPQVGAPMQNNGMLTEQQMMQKYLQNGGTAATSNSVINEQVTNVARELLNENFGKLYAEAMKNSIIETYKAEVIREAINENRGFIEQIVRETIIDLQKKAQSRK